MEGQAYTLEGQRAGNDPVLEAARTWLENYFAGERPEPQQLPLNPKGTEFQKRVWRLLLEIPYGQVTTYGALAAKLAQERGGKMSAQAIGGAVGRNPISIIIPCHRVIGANGRLTGYAGGLWRKQALLRLEGAMIKSE
jgi:methylated-DNA-[protein]-cysteine S-methyltransferase